MVHTYYNCNLRHIIIPETVTTLDKFCFSRCYIDTLEWSESITEVKDSCFYDAYSHDIICKAKTPPIIDDNLFQPNNFYRLIVPEDAIEAYKAAPGWKHAEKFSAIEETDIKDLAIEGLSIDTDGNNLTLSGLKDGTQVRLYSLDGKRIGGGIASGGSVSLQTSETFVIAKIGNQTVKIAMNKNL